jgi:hypothetical protein
LDATDSRRPTWDRAANLTGEMFDAAIAIGRLDVQLVYFRGLDECKASGWLSDAASLKSAMTKITTESGQTQIGKILKHAVNETAKQKIGALAYVGDCVEEYPENLYAQAIELHTPLFIFQEGNDPEASIVFSASGAPDRRSSCLFRSPCWQSPARSFSRSCRFHGRRCQSSG